MKKRVRRDWAADKFDLLEELGESMSVVFFRYHPEARAESDVLSFDLFHHTDYDGIGFITHLMEEAGVTDVPQPVLQDQDQPPFLQRLKVLGRFIKRIRPLQWEWRQWSGERGLPEGFAVVAFSRERTARLLEALRTLKISTTAAYVTALDGPASRMLLARPTPRRWLLPVNMRGRGTLERSYGNITASLLVDLEGAYTAEEVDARIKQDLTDRLHWGSWILSNVSLFIGRRALKRAMAKDQGNAFGIVSNMGSWPLKGTSLPAGLGNGIVCGMIAPVARLLPLGALANVWDGRLVLTLQLHPTLQLPLEASGQLIEEWARALLALQPGPASEEAASDDLRPKLIRYADLPNYPARWHGSDQAKRRIAPHPKAAKRPPLLSRIVPRQA